MIFGGRVLGLLRSQFLYGSKILKPLKGTLPCMLQRYQGHILPATLLPPVEAKPHPKIFTPLLGVVPALIATFAEESDSESDENGENTNAVVAPRGKHLWCQDNSYGYTKGTSSYFFDVFI
jgi:hypothetical protein